MRKLLSIKELESEKYGICNPAEQIAYFQSYIPSNFVERHMIKKALLKIKADFFANHYKLGFTNVLSLWLEECKEADLLTLRVKEAVNLKAIRVA